MTSGLISLKAFFMSIIINIDKKNYRYRRTKILSKSNSFEDYYQSPNSKNYLFD
jgi:hypothetical protein